MAEDVNLPLDQTRNTSKFQFLRDSDRPRRIEGQEEELNNPDRAREEQEQQLVNDVESLESRVELFQGASQQADEDLRNPTDLNNQEVKQDIAEAERRELQGSHTVADADRIKEFENITRIDVGSLESRVELFQGASQQADEDLRNPIDLNNQEAKQDIAEAERREFQGSHIVEGVDRIDSVQEEVAVEEEDAVRNEPAIGTYEQSIEPTEESENPIQEGLGASSLLGPQPSELREDSDASAVETERGQNISSLI
jgi:hypothetical protein